MNVERAIIRFNEAAFEHTISMDIAYEPNEWTDTNEVNVWGERSGENTKVKEKQMAKLWN